MYNGSLQHKQVLLEFLPEVNKLRQNRSKTLAPVHCTNDTLKISEALNLTTSQANVCCLICPKICNFNCFNMFF